MSSSPIIPSPNICIEVILNLLECASVNKIIDIINKTKENAIDIIEPIVYLLKNWLSNSIWSKPTLIKKPNPKPNIEAVWNIVK